MILTLIVGVIALAVCLVIGTGIVSPQYSPTDSSVGGIRANSCDADELCEVNSIGKKLGDGNGSGNSTYTEIPIRGRLLVEETVEANEIESNRIKAV